MIYDLVTFDLDHVICRHIMYLQSWEVARGTAQSNAASKYL